jgi:death-on-curing protein
MYVHLPSEEFIREIHEMVIEYFGGKQGELHPGIINLAIERPKQYIFYENCNFHTVCAVILQTLACKHPFVDGNKRTALTTTISVYRLNGIDLDYEQASQKEFVDLMLWVVENKPSIQEISIKLETLTNRYEKAGAKRALSRARYLFSGE